MMNKSARTADPQSRAPQPGAAAEAGEARRNAETPVRRGGAGHDRTPAPGAAPGNRADASGGDETGRTRVLVVDDHAIVREGIASVLETDERIEVVGEAGDGIEALELLQQLQADVVLMDVNMPRMNGIEATREIHSRWPGLQTVGLSVQTDPPTAELMREAGAAGFIPKSGDSEEMIGTILQVASERGSSASS